MRDSRLLPITNRALRGVKKAVTDAQNVATAQGLLKALKK